jgi:ornithine--oxo-acid transaminase
VDVIKILPPLMIGEKEVERFVAALDGVLEDCRSFPGTMWDLGSSFVRHSVKRNAAKPVAVEIPS